MGFDLDYNGIMDEALLYAAQNGIQPSSQDRVRVCLFPIDMQRAFCDPNAHQLPVEGAIHDCARTAEFIYRNLPRITTIIPTLDTHSPIQIFHRMFLVGKDGQPPPANTPITHGDVMSGKWQVNPGVAEALLKGEGPNALPWLKRHLECYTDSLENPRNGALSNKTGMLMVWAFHALLGSQGHALMPILEEAFRFHEFARVSPLEITMKGMDPLRESYSVFGPAVKYTHDGKYNHDLDNTLMRHVLSHDMVIVAGEASSHCVLDSLKDMLEEIKRGSFVRGGARALCNKVYIMGNCMSPVVVVRGDPVLDYTRAANEGLAALEAEGMHLVRSTQPMDEWPGSPFREET